MGWAIAAICIGSCIGGLSRWALGLCLSGSGTLVPWGTLAANWIGGYLIGVAVAFFQAMPQLDPAWRLAVITGFLGGLTTFSSFSAEVVGLLLQQRYILALGTASMHVVGSFMLTALGIWSFQSWFHPGG